MFLCIYVNHSKTNISIVRIFLMYAKDDNKDNNNNNNKEQYSGMSMFIFEMPCKV